MSEQIREVELGVVFICGNVANSSPVPTAWGEWDESGVFFQHSCAAFSDNTRVGKISIHNTFPGGGGRWLCELGGARPQGRRELESQPGNSVVVDTSFVPPLAIQEFINNVHFFLCKSVPAPLLIFLIYSVCIMESKWNDKKKFTAQQSTQLQITSASIGMYKHWNVRT